MNDAMHFFLYAAIPAEQQKTLSRHARIMFFVHEAGLVSLFDMKQEFPCVASNNLSADLNTLTKRGHLRQSGKPREYRWSINQEKLRA